METDTGTPVSEALALSEEQVLSLGQLERRFRVFELMQESFAIYDWAVDKYVTSGDRQLVGTVVLFSGGNVSTVLADLFKGIATHAAHANTTVGIEQTRQFVRDTCEAWGLPLIEMVPEREQDRYRALVLDRGFPGPAHHWKMFQRLKERVLKQVRRQLVTNSRRERVIYLAGRRRTESNRRANIPEFERAGSIVYVSPLVNWTKADMNTYRSMFAVPHNEVADLIHMSGECLCGAFAHQNEREEISSWFPEAFTEIAELEELLTDRTDIPEQCKRWGWGGDAETLKQFRKERPKTGRLCSSCDARFLPKE